MTTLKVILSVIGRFFAFFLPFVKSTVSKAEKVAPDVQREIDRILADAKNKVDGLRASHSLASIEKQMNEDVAAVRDTAEHHIALIKQTARAQMNELNKVLPDVASQLGLNAVATAIDPPKPPELPSA